MKCVRFEILAACLVLGGLVLPAAAAPLVPGALAEAARRAGIAFGAAVDTDSTPAQREIAAREFTSATPENALKWSQLSPAPGVYDFTRADAGVDWAEQNGLRQRGHTLFWDRLNGVPDWLDAEVAAAPDPAAHLTELMQLHAQTVVARYGDRIAQWDVVNEPLALGGGTLDPESLFAQTLGESYLDIAFHSARAAAAPDTLLFLNETLTEAPSVFEGLMQLLGRLLDRGVPLDGVGLQNHFFLVPPDRAALQAQIERIAALGLTVELTELDIPLFLFEAEPDPLAAQARAYADVVSACLAVDACTGITVWGVDDSDTWLDTFFLSASRAPNRPLLFDALGQPKPAYDAVVLALPEPGMGALTALTLLGLVLGGGIRTASRPCSERRGCPPAAWPRSGAVASR